MAEEAVGEGGRDRGDDGGEEMWEGKREERESVGKEKEED